MTLLQFVAAHQLGIVLALLYVGSAAVSALPAPGADQPFGRMLYQWLFCFTHTLMNNVEQAAKAKYPQLNLGGPPAHSDPTPAPKGASGDSQ